jgi:nucleotide-binding universal stress UspA family protein
MDKVKKILVPIDFSADSGSALHDALPLAHETKAQLIALHIIDINSEREIFLSSLAPVGGWPCQTYGSELPPLDVLRRERTLDLWNFVAQKAGPENQARIAKVVRTGRPSREIAAFIGEEQIDLLVLKLRRRLIFPDRGTSRLIKIARRLSCPVLLDPPAAASGDEPRGGLPAFDLVSRLPLLGERPA